MKTRLKIRLQKIESRLGNPLEPVGIFLQTKEIDGKERAYLINISPKERHSSFHLNVILPAKGNGEDEDPSPYFYKITDEYLKAQPAIAQLLRENNYL